MLINAVCSVLYFYVLYTQKVRLEYRTDMSKEG